MAKFLEFRGMEEPKEVTPIKYLEYVEFCGLFRLGQLKYVYVIMFVVEFNLFSFRFI